MMRGGKDPAGASKEGLCGGTKIACDGLERSLPYVRGKAIFREGENISRGRSIVAELFRTCFSLGLVVTTM